MGSPHSRISLTVWRISNHRDLSGRGGLIATGRWHRTSRTVMYCADAPFTAYCEILKHLGSPLFLPAAAKLLEIKAPPWAQVDAVALDDLPADWSDDAGSGYLACQSLGDAWLASGAAPLLKVPSAARPSSFNYLINPAHRDADHFEIVRHYEPPFPEWATKAD